MTSPAGHVSRLSLERETPRLSRAPRWRRRPTQREWPSSPARPPVRHPVALTTRVLTSVAGIGRECAVALAKAGWSLVLFARRTDQLAETQQACPDPARVLVVQGDVTSEADVKRVFAAALERFGASPVRYRCVC